jgi:dinuclear metal center YbgI/SA1388 family protein
MTSRLALHAIVTALDDILQTREIPDYSGAVNGLQLENSGAVTSIASAVDFSSETVDRAIAAGANLLLVHHGMFWGGVQPITGAVHRRLRALIAADVAVYSSHLPLDLHPDFGNNVLLAKQLGLTPTAGFARYKTIDVGVSGQCDLATSDLVAAADRLARARGGSVVAPPLAPDRRTRHWGICTGAGASSESIAEAMEKGIDTIIVGEGPHHTAVLGRDLGITIVYAGHYATETLGVQALGEHVGRLFSLEHSFIDVPTGL